MAPIPSFKGTLASEVHKPEQEGEEKEEEVPGMILGEGLKCNLKWRTLAKDLPLLPWRQRLVCSLVMPHPRWLIWGLLYQHVIIRGRNWS